MTTEIPVKSLKVGASRKGRQINLYVGKTFSLVYSESLEYGKYCIDGYESTYPGLGRLWFQRFHDGKWCVSRAGYSRATMLNDTTEGF